MPTSVTRLTNTGTLLASSNFDEVTYALQNPGTTNILRNTNSLGPLGASAVSTVSGNWTGYCNAGTATNITYNTTDVAAPDGSYTATRIVRDNVASCGANTNAWGLLTTAAGVFTAGKTYTVSAWIMTNGPTISGMYIGGNDYYATNITPTSTWQRFSYTFTPSGAVNTLDRAFQIQTSATNVTYYVWGAQTEEGSVATPYQGWNPGTNIALASQQLDNNSFWAKGNSSITADITVAPDGSLTADKLVESVALGEHNIAYYASQGSNITETLSVYAKAGERYQIVMSFSNYVNADARVYFNLNTGTIFTTTYSKLDYSNVSGTITGVGNGWYRCSLTATKAAYNTNNYPNIMLYSNSAASTTYTGDGTSGAYLWGMQLELGSVATAYRATTTVNLVPTTRTFLRESTGAVYATNTLDEVTYNQSAPAIVNLIQYSQDFDNASYWTYTGTSVIANATKAPDGTQTADKLVGTTGVSGRKSVYQYPATFLAGRTYTYSVYLKTAGITTATMWFDTVNTSGGAYWGAGALISLIDGTTSDSSPNQVSTTSVGDGWYRCQVTATITADSTAPVQIAIGSVNGGATQVGNGTDGIFIWGAQLELDVAPSPYQPKTVNAIVAPSFRKRVANNGPVYVTSTFDEWTGVPTTNGLVFWYDAGQPASYPGVGSGTTWHDLSTSSNGYLAGAGSGGFPQFDYSTPSFTVSPTRGMANSPVAATNTTSFTLEAWVLHTSFAANSGFGNIISIRENYQNRGYRFGVATPNGLVSDTTGTPVFWTNQSGGNFSANASTYPISLNTWYQVCVTYDPSSRTCQLWFNGALLYTQTNATFIPPTSSDGLNIGASPQGCTSLLGKMAIFKQYNYALSASEISQNFTALRGRFGI